MKLYRNTTVRSRWLGWKRKRGGQMKASATSTSSSLFQQDEQREQVGAAVSGVKGPNAKWQTLESQDDDRDDQFLQRNEREATLGQRVSEEAQVSLLDRFAVVEGAAEEATVTPGTEKQRLDMCRASKPALRKALLRWLPIKNERQVPTMPWSRRGNPSATTAKTGLGLGMQEGRQGRPARSNSQPQPQDVRPMG